MDYIALGKLVRQHRQTAHLTLAQLAEKADISIAHLGHIERGTRTLSLDTLVALSKALDVTPNELIPDFATAPGRDLPAEWTALDRARMLQLLSQARQLLTEAVLDPAP